jgi:Right handed beta helix region
MLSGRNWWSLTHKGLILLVVLISLTLQVHADIVEILPGQSIQAALRQASENTTIKLLPGIHRENLRIEKGIHLLGDVDHPESVILEGGMAGPVIMISGSDAEQQTLVEGMTIRSASGFLPDGILYLAAASIQCSKLIIESCQGNGITVAGSGSVLITDCLIRTNGRVGIDVQNETSIVEGSRNDLHSNGADLGGFAPPGLRIPMAPQTSSLTVQVPEQYSSLQEAVDATPDGGTILVSDGEFQTGLTIWKDVSIIGRGQRETTLIPVGADRVTLSILSVAQSVSLQQLTLMATEQRSIAIFGRLDLEDVTVIGQRTINQDAVFKLHAEGTFDARSCRFTQIGGIAIQALSNSLVNLADCTFSGNYQDVCAEGASNITIVSSQFANTRWRAVTIIDTSFTVEDSTFTACMGSLEVGASMGTLRGVESAGATQDGIVVYDGANVTLEECVLTGSGGYNLKLVGNAIANLSSCTLSQATLAGIVALGTSSFTIDATSISGNNGSGLFVSDQAQGEITASIIQENGKLPVVLETGDEANSAGIVVSMNSHLILRSVDILNNYLDGILFHPEDPFYDELIDLPNPMAVCPIIEMYDCRIDYNTEAGIYVMETGLLKLSNCTVASNGMFGIYLEGLLCGFSGGWGPDAEYDCVSVEGIHASFDQCDIRNNLGIGLTVEGGAGANIHESSITQNGIGIVMDLAATLELTLNEIVANAEYGVWFYSEDCEDSLCTYAPKKDRLTGYGNLIPGQSDYMGNGAAFTSDPVEYLLAPAKSKK